MRRGEKKLKWGGGGCSSLPQPTPDVRTPALEEAERPRRGVISPHRRLLADRRWSCISWPHCTIGYSELLPVGSVRPVTSFPSSLICRSDR